MPERSADDIQRDIEQSRAALAAAVDQLAYRGNPKRMVEKVKDSVKEKAQTPAGKAVIVAAGGIVVFLVIRRIRAH